MQPVPLLEHCVGERRRYRACGKEQVRYARHCCAAGKYRRSSLSHATDEEGAMTRAWCKQVSVVRGGRSENLTDAISKIDVGWVMTRARFLPIHHRQKTP